MADSLVPVAVACPCPGTPHSDGDTVFLRPKLGLHGAALAQRKLIDAVNGKADADEIVATLMEVYCRYGPAAWTFEDEKGEPLPLNEQTIADTLFADGLLGLKVGDAADDLYTKGLLDPLRIGASKSSATMPTNGLTSQRTTSSRKRPKPSKSSSTTTSPMEGTVTT